MKLLKPKFTMAALIAGLSSLATLCLSVVFSLSPLESIHELAAIRPWIVTIVVGCGITTVVCLVLCAVGRSIVAMVDHLSTPATGASNPPSPAAYSPTAPHEGGIPVASILDAFAPIEGQVADEILALVKANQPAILAQAQKLELSGATELENLVISRVPELAPYAAQITGVLGPVLVNVVGNENQALLLAAEAAIGTFAKAHGG